MSSKEPARTYLENPAHEELVGLQADKLQRVIHNVRFRPPKKRWNIENLGDIDLLREQIKREVHSG